MAKRRKIRKQDVNQALLDSIFRVEREWKHIQSIVQKSVDPMDASINLEKLAREKYLYLLREARHRKISAIRF